MALAAAAIDYFNACFKKIFVVYKWIFKLQLSRLMDFTGVSKFYSLSLLNVKLEGRIAAENFLLFCGKMLGKIQCH